MHGMAHGTLCRAFDNFFFSLPFYSEPPKFISYYLTEILFVLLLLLHFLLDSIPCVHFFFPWHVLYASDV
jgi:hypothetical protein